MIPLKSIVFPRELCKPKRISKPFKTIVIELQKSEDVGMNWA